MCLSDWWTYSNREKERFHVKKCRKNIKNIWRWKFSHWVKNYNSLREFEWEKKICASMLRMRDTEYIWNKSTENIYVSERKTRESPKVRILKICSEWKYQISLGEEKQKTRTEISSWFSDDSDSRIKTKLIQVKRKTKYLQF